MKAAEKLFGELTIGMGSALGRGWWWREFKEANKPQVSCTKMVTKTGSFQHFWDYISPKTPFFSQKDLLRYAPKMFLRNH
jgi:hypothetical protein